MFRARYHRAVLASRLGIALGGAIVFVALGCSSPKPALVVSLDDPDGRLGPPPWTLAVFNPYFGPDRDRAMRTVGSAAPDRPLAVLTRGRPEEWRIRDLLVEDQSVVFGLVLPALRTDGYWLARVDHEPGRFSGTGGALFCLWGQVEPDESIEALSIEVSQWRDAPGLQLETKVGIPARSRTKERGRP
ncbi:hypothetical protein LuPra_05135 [Luteitalea pratensis]|uniref:Uncharacterized protein n=1 Tax=Luteitalea pratensis TaxID=1855912 RepID=A0A143PUK7_LUTPR|nr:hypothetical protein LuPra_05135 [Luteitalea pratensis]